MVHDYELSYSDTPLLEAVGPLRHEKLELIQYSEGLVHAASIVMDWLADDADFGLGFLTGSAPLMWLLRELYPNRLAGRLNYVPGLAHRRYDGERHLRASLNGFLADGMRRLFVIDEVVSGTQLNTNASAIERWAKEFHSTKRLPVLLVGVQPSRSKISVQGVCSLVRGAKRHNRPKVAHFTVRLVNVPELLASDDRGRLIKGLRKGRGESQYFNSRWRVEGYVVECSRAVGTDCAPYSVLYSSSSTDVIFGGAIKRLLRPSTSKATSWPDLAQCEQCRAALNELRARVASLPSDSTDGAVKLGSLAEVRKRAQSRIVVVSR